MPKPRFARNYKKAKFKPHFKGKFSTPQANKEYKHHDQLQEADVGITQFISKLEGFSGIIKARFSDFQVNEIDLNGDVAKLTNQKIPQDFNIQPEVKEVPVETPLPEIPQDIWDGIKKLVDSSGAPPVELDATTLTKEQRTQIHETLKKNFGRKVNGNTETDGDKKKMVFKKFDGKGDYRWPKELGDYVHFVLYKESIDTLEATLRIAHALKVPASVFTYAGVKDKRAKTTQWFSAKRIEPWKLIIKTKSIRNIRIGNITFKNTPLKLGDLTGNKFRIALRNVTGSDELMEESLQSLKEKGFINYYGLQRFGNDKEAPTFSIGLHLLLGNWKEACEIILKPTEADRPELDITKAKKVYAATGDPGKALEEFDENKKTCIEYLLLEGLNKGHKKDYVNALGSIPRNTRLLYLHSFQSLVWNSMVSKRIEKFGLEVVEGDLVFVDKTPDSRQALDDENEESQRPEVKALTPEECSQYTIYDVVLPLPGFDVTYPKYLEEYYKEILEAHGLTLEMTQQKVKENSVSGAYRKMMNQVKDLSWKIMHYDDPNYNLIRSDLEELKGEEEPQDVLGGAYKALILEFSLASSCYATMVLRELLKTDTSTSAHAKLNNYHTENEPKTKMRTQEFVSNETEVEEEKIGLLEDAKRYEEFKNLVFGVKEESTKRKHEESTENVDAKVAKIEKKGG